MTTPPVVVPPPTGRTRLITDPHDPMVVTPHRETDVRTAMARGLKEYLEQLVVDFAGREVRFAQVLQTWSDEVTPAQYPAAVVLSPDPMTYGGEDDAGGDAMTPGLPAHQKFADGRYYTSPSEGRQTFAIEVWANDATMRMGLIALLEDALNPVEWMAGFRLELPHYHGLRADGYVVSCAYIDSEDDAAQRRRKAAVSVSMRLPLLRVLGTRPDAQVRSVVEINPAELEPKTAEELAADAPTARGTRC